MKKIINYLKAVRGELRHVSWPTRRQVIQFTSLVVVLSILVAYFLGFFDYIFTQLLDALVI